MRRPVRALSLALLFVLTGLGATRAAAQNADLYDLYQKRDLQGCLDGALARLQASPQDRDLNQLAGRCLVEIGRPGEARPYLEIVVHAGGQKDWKYGFALVALGQVRWFEEDREGARDAWTEAAYDPDLATVKQAGETDLKMCGLTADYDRWTAPVGDQVRCRFAPEIAAGERAAFVARAEATWTRLADFFGGQPDRPAEILVWADDPTAIRVAGVPKLGFTFGALWVAHTRVDLPLGKDLAPVFYQWVSQPTERSPFLAAGLAEACDGRVGVDRIAEARAAIAAAPAAVNLDIPTWWQDNRAIDWSVARPIGGALVQTLLDRGGAEKLRLLLHMPTYFHAREIYGPDQLDAILTEFTATLRAN